MFASLPDPTPPLCARIRLQAKIGQAANVQPAIVSVTFLGTISSVVILMPSSSKFSNFKI